MTNMPRALREALHYAERGIPIVPIAPGKKAPLVEGGSRAATCCLDAITGWWQKWPSAQLALACGSLSGFDALDVDKQHGGIEAYNRLLLEHQPDGIKTARQDTPSGGFHLLFQHRPGLKNRCGGRGIVPLGLDCRTSGGMILTAPTPGYRWSKSWSLDDLPPWPSWLIDFYKEIKPAADITERRAGRRTCYNAPERYIDAATQGIAREIEQASPGNQYCTLNALSFRAGCLLASALGVDSQPVIDCLTTAGMAMENDPSRRPWRSSEIKRIVQQAIQDGLEEGYR